MVSKSLTTEGSSLSSERTGPSVPKSPFEGNFYENPVPFAGTNHYVTVTGWTAYVTGHFKPWGPNRDNVVMEYGERDFSFGVDLAPGRLYTLSTRYSRTQAGGSPTEYSDWHDGGWFYVLTPPETRQT